MFSFILSKGFGEHFKQLEFLYITGFSLQVRGWTEFFILRIINHKATERSFPKEAFKQNQRASESFDFLLDSIRKDGGRL